MKINDLIEISDAKPIVYVDMDGVLADLYAAAAEFSDVDHYNNMTDAQWESFFKDSDAYHLFRDIKPFSTTNQLLRLVKKYAGKYTILSSPLSFDREGSIKGKREWMLKNITVHPDNIIFDHEKFKYAKQSDGTPNVLIDDWKGNTVPWDAHGGTAIKYQADESPVSIVEDALKKIFGDK